VALETFNFLDSLVPANPPVSDGVVQGDDHIRGIKLALKNTFPNITGAVTATQADLNDLVGGVKKLNGSGTYFAAPPEVTTLDGFKSTVAGDIDVILQGNVAATFQRVGGADSTGKNFFKVTGGIEATAEIKGPGITPLGAAVMWFDDALPNDGLWVWANGQVVVNAATVCPILLARWGKRFGGDGVTTMGVPDMQEVVPVGKFSMGGAPSPNFLTSVVAAAKGVVGGFFGSDTQTLVAGQIPNISSVGSVSVSGSISGTTSGLYNAGVNVNAPNSQATNIGGAGPSAPLAVSGSFSGSGSASVVSNNTGGGAPAHNNLQPSRAVNWIIRIG
jgi:microcystin-dependent protein